MSGSPLKASNQNTISFSILREARELDIFKFFRIMLFGYESRRVNIFLASPVYL